MINNLKNSKSKAKRTICNYCDFAEGIVVTCFEDNCNK